MAMDSALSAQTILEPSRAAAGRRVLLGHVVVLFALFAALSAVYWAGIYYAIGEPGMPLDDSYIHLQYARSIVQGHPFEYNPGERSNGSSAPLWTVILAGAYVVTGDWLVAAYVAGVFFTAGCVALTYWLVLRWTHRPGWALFGAAMLLVMHPTLIWAYGGMEVPAYTAAFLLGLLAYDMARTAGAGGERRWRLAASAVFAVAVWLRPEFLLMPILIGLERAISLRRTGSGWRGAWVREMALHGVLWLVLFVPYAAFNEWTSGRWLPNTFAVKAVARNATAEVVLAAGLPAAWHYADWRAALRCLALWEPMMAVSLVFQLFLNNAVMARRMPQFIKQGWQGSLGAAGLLGVITLIAFPLGRALVDPVGLLQFQFQRYFGQITPLMVLLAVAWWASRSVASGPSRRLVVAATAAGTAGFAVTTLIAVTAVQNIHDMQVYLGRWMAKHTPPDAVIATNDVGAIAFYSGRRVVDTVGLTEPALAAHYLAGGTLEEYLQRIKPQYACMFSKWHGAIARRSELFEIMFKVRLKFNVICGARSMWVLRSRWNPRFGEGRIDPEAAETASARCKQRIRERADLARS